MDKLEYTEDEFDTINNKSMNALVSRQKIDLKNSERSNKLVKIKEEIQNNISQFMQIFDPETEPSYEWPGDWKEYIPIPKGAHEIYLCPIWEEGSILTKFYFSYAYIPIVYEFKLGDKRQGFSIGKYNTELRDVAYCADHHCTCITFRIPKGKTKMCVTCGTYIQFKFK